MDKDSFRKEKEKKHFWSGTLQCFIEIQTFKAIISDGRSAPLSKLRQASLQIVEKVNSNETLIPLSVVEGLKISFLN